MKKILPYVLMGTLFSSLLLSGCAGSASSLDPDHPVTLTLWHVYGEQAESPMNTLVEEFNNTAGREKGVLIDVTAMSNATAIGGQLLDAQKGSPGAGEMPDLFFCHPANAEALGTESLFDWSSCFTKEEMSAFVPDFVEEGRMDGKQIVLPFAKSTHLLFLNGTRFEKFASETGISDDDLATWEGFYRTADRYYTWSGGKPFCAFDFVLTSLRLEAEADGSSVITDQGWFDTDSPSFYKAFHRFAEALVKGTVVVSDQYSNTQVMTGDVVAGLSSSAAILYYNDTVTYPDNTSEPLRLKVLPPPHADSGTTSAIQAGVGLCAKKAEGRKAEGISVFAHWLTESSRNLDFAAATGYMPVRNDVFDAIDSYTFKNEAYTQLYKAFSEVRKTAAFKTEPSIDKYFENADRFYDEVRQMQGTLHARCLKGEKADVLAEEYWQSIVSMK